MSDPRGHERYGPPQPAPTWSQGPVYPPTDPAYADQAPYAATYGGSYSPWAPNEANSTQQLPPYWQQGQAVSGEPPDAGAPPPEGPRTPRWLWFVAGAAVLLVIALVIALVVANISTKSQTAVEPLPPMPTPSTTAPMPTKRTSPTSPSLSPSPATTTESGVPAPTATTGQGAMQTVVYTVSGDGRAISVSYMDSGNVVQTEFNVALPWSKEVSLARSTTSPPSVTIINIGHNVTCSVTVGGVQVRQRTGVGLTICDAPL